MAVAVGVEVGRMALGAGAARSTIDRSIAMTIDANSEVAVGRIVAGGARGFVDGGDPVAGVARGGSAGGGGQH